MKKVVVFLLLICSFAGFSQPIITRTLGTNTVSDPRLMSKLNFFSPRYADTTAANLEKGIDSCGAMIYTYDVDGFWYRQCFPKKWVRFSAGSSTLTFQSNAFKKIGDQVFIADSLDGITAPKMQFFPSKDGAFKVGKGFFNEGNVDSIGNFSFSSGIGTIASGAGSNAMGYYVHSIGNISSGIGYKLIATNRHEFIVGRLNDTTGRVKDDTTYLFTVGNGDWINDTRSNIFQIKRNGIRITDGTQAAGYVYTSDALGNASWQAPSSSFTQATADGLYSPLAHTHTFASLTSKPSTLLGYGITDAYPLSGNPSGFLTTIGAGTVTNAMLAGSIDLTSKVTGLLPDGNISSASTWNAKESALTFGLGLSRSVNTVVVDTSSASILSRQRAAATYLTISTAASTYAPLNSPTLTTPIIGAATATSINGNTITTGTGTLTIAAGKTFTSSNTLTFAGTDGSTLNVGTGGTLGTNAYTSTTYLPSAGATYTTTTGNGLDINSSTLTTGNLVSIGLTGTAATSNTKTGLSITSSGANGTSSQTVTGQKISVTNTGTTNTNVGLNVTASGATNNYAALFTGRIGIGTSSPTTALNIDVTSAGDGLTVQGTSPQFSLNQSTAQFGSFGVASSAAAFSPLAAQGDVIIRANQSTGVLALRIENQNTQPIIFSTTTSGYAGTTERLRILSGGNVGVGVTAPTSLLHIKAGTATANTAPFQYTAGVVETVARSGVQETDANNDVYSTNSTAVRGKIIVVRLNSSSAGTLTLATTYTHYVFTGTTTTWTLPAVSGTTGHIFYIKNRGSGAITLNTAASANELYTTSAVNTLSIAAGEGYAIVSDGTYFDIQSRY